MLLGGILLTSLCCWGGGGYTADVFVLLGGGYIADVFVLLRGRVQLVIHSFS